MSTNQYFPNYSFTAEQTLTQDLIDEAIQIHGYDVYYCPVTLVNEDDILREATLKTVSNAYSIEMYIRDVQGFTGDGKFLSKFGLEIRDEITFTVSKRRFANTVTGADSDIIRPREGDVIYLPLNGKAFSIKFVDHEATFYQNGTLQVLMLCVKSLNILAKHSRPAFLKLTTSIII
jgi:hypothetical protein